MIFFIAGLLGLVLIWHSYYLGRLEGTKTKEKDDE